MGRGAKFIDHGGNCVIARRSLLEVAFPQAGRITRTIQISKTAPMKPEIR